MAKSMSYKQRQYIQTLADQLGIATFKDLNALARECGALTWQMADVDQASEMIAKLKKMKEASSE
jgi:hypothetical protein